LEVGLFLKASSVVAEVFFYPCCSVAMVPTLGAIPGLTERAAKTLFAGDLRRRQYLRIALRLLGVAVEH
jgi:hypothetical protein